MSDLLERELTELANALAVPASYEVVTVVMARLDDDDASHRVVDRPVRTRRLVVVVVASVAAAVIVALALPGPRHAVAHFFGIGSTRIEQAPSSTPAPATESSGFASSAPTSVLPSAPTSAPTPTATEATFSAQLRLGAQVTATEAAASTGLDVPLASDFGAPAGIFVASPPTSGQIIVIYAPAASLPETAIKGVGALLSAVPGTIEEGYFVKEEAVGTVVAPQQITTASGEVVHGVWLGGTPHLLMFRAADGETVYDDTLRLATNTLLWQVGSVVYRLESGLSLADAIHVAMSVTTRAD